MRRAVPILLLLALLAGCGQLPRPFQPDAKTTLDLQSLSERNTILVLPLEGEAAPESGDGAAAMADALIAAGLPARTSGGGPQSPLLRGVMRLRPRAPGREEMVIDWRIRDADGKLLAEHRQNMMLPAGLWGGGDAVVLDVVTRDAAAALAEAVLGPPAEYAVIPGFPGANLVVLPVEGAPGDGATSLSAALQKELQAAELPLAGLATDRDLLIAGKVELDEAQAGAQTVTITWSVLRAANKDEIGRISQRNRVRSGSLTRAWGRTAQQVAQAAAPGIRELLDQASRQAARR